MKKEVSMNIKNKYLKIYKEGSPLITKEALININKLNDEGMLVKLYSEDNEFVGKGYYGKQNKGYGWILSKNEEEQFDKVFFESKIAKAFALRQEYLTNEETTAFRLLNGEGDALGGLTIDYFDGYMMVTWYSKGIYSFSEAILEALENVITNQKIKYLGLYQKKRFDDKGTYVEDNDFVSGSQAPEPLIIKENNMNYAIYLNDGPMVGIFLDQREVRKTLRDQYAKGKTVLNTFSYTGAFSVACALGGSIKTTSVDLANRSRAKTKEQFEINNINLDQQDIIVEDVFNYFKYAGRKELTFDIVILDPPSFARSKKHTFTVSKDYVELLKDAIAITNEKGIIVASTNYSSLSMTKFKKFIDIAFKEAGFEYSIKETFSLPKDFRADKNALESDYLKVVFVQKH